MKDNRLDQLEFARQKQTYCYFSAAATLFSPQMSDARICWAKNSILTTVVDDFFDIGGSREELHDLISLVEKFVLFPVFDLVLYCYLKGSQEKFPFAIDNRWDANWEKKTHSEQVKIIFSALFDTINELGTKASALQKRTVTHHLVEIVRSENSVFFFLLSFFSISFF